jgi:membrane protein
VWLGFAALYSIVPNTRVRLRYALLGGVVAGTMWSFLTWFYIAFQYGLSKYSLLYSTFAQFPVLLMWVYFSWVIVLFGAELTFAYQNEKTFALERHADRASYAYREALGLRTMLDIARRFEWGIVGLAAEEAAREWNVPLRLLNAILDEFQKARLVTSSTGDPTRYTPGRPLDKIRVADVVNALREAGCDPTALREDEAFRPLLEHLNSPRDGFLELTLNELTDIGAPPKKVDWPAPADL